MKRLIPMAAALSAVACQSSPSQAPKTPARVETLTLSEQTEWTQSHRFLGRVKNGQLSTLGFEVGGQVETVLVEAGQVVAKGEALAYLDRRKTRAGIRRVKASLGRARAQYQLNLRTDRRVRSLAKERFASAQRADEARFGAEVAGQSVEELEASLQSLQIDLEKAVLRAPYRGRIARRLLDEGTVVGVGTPVFELMSREGKEVSVGVTLEAFRTLEIGEELEVRIDGVRGAGRVTQLIHQIDPRSRTARVILALPAQADATEGQVADVVLPVRHTDPGFWVPISALRPGPEGLWTLLLVEGASAPNRAWLTPQPISILHFDGERAYAAGPLEDGQSVVKSGHHRLVPGQLVEPIAALEVTP